MFMDKNQGQGKKNILLNMLPKYIWSKLQFENTSCANGRIFAAKFTNGILKWWFLNSDSLVILILN